MRRRVLSSMVAVLLLSAAARPEKFEPPEEEKFVGAVKTVHTTTTLFKKESGKWVKSSEPDEETVEIPDVREKTNADQEEDETADADDFVETDPDKSARAIGYSAGYATSLGNYGFYKLDDRDNIVEAVHYSPKRELIGRDYYAYDASGKEIEKASYDADGKFTQTCLSSYDGRGNRIEEICCRADGVHLRKSTWSYDDKDNVTNESLFQAGKLSYRLTFDYQYDRVGNWIKRVRVIEDFDGDHSKSQTMEVAERNITYR